MASLIDRHAGRIVGVLSCLDRVVIQGTIPSVCHAKAVETLLHAHDIRMFDYGPLFADPFGQSIRSHVDRIAAEEGVEVEYIKKPKSYRKDRASQPLTCSGLRSERSSSSTNCQSWSVNWLCLRERRRRPFAASCACKCGR